MRAGCPQEIQSVASSATVCIPTYFWSFSFFLAANADFASSFYSFSILATLTAFSLAIALYFFRCRCQLLTYQLPLFSSKLGCFSLFLAVDHRDIVVLANTIRMITQCCCLYSNTGCIDNNGANSIQHLLHLLPMMLPTGYIDHNKQSLN